MRVTNASTYRNFTAGVNEVHSRLNKSMNKVSSGKAYENAAANSLAYYQGKKIDQTYWDNDTKLTLLTDIKNRLYQQELGARSIQESLSTAKNQVEFALNGTNLDNPTTLDTVKQKLQQLQQSMVNDLNLQYQSFYVYGGNDVTTSPFSLSDDGMTLTYTHQFPGNPDVTEIKMTLEQQADGTYVYDIQGGDLTNIVKAMKEQGRVDVGYGSILDKDTLLDTYTGGMNLLTGINSDTVKGLSDADAEKAVKAALNKNPIALIGQAVGAITDFQDDPDAEGARDTLHDVLTETMTSMKETEHTLSTVYSDLGNKYSILETTEERLNATQDSLTEQYTDILGADPYESIMEMFSNQYSYSAALQVGSKLMGSSLFDFMG